jgi:hypothetical protein
MRVRLEFGDSAGRMDNEIHSTKVVVVDDLKELFRGLMKAFIEKWDLTEEEDIDCLNEFSEVDEELGEFYIGMDEGKYIGGWRLV